MFESMSEAVEAASREGISLGEAALRAEAADGIRTREVVEGELGRALGVMRDAVTRGLAGSIRSVSGIVGGNAARLKASHGPLAGSIFTDTIAAALAVQEVNAAMGVIVAAPTAGGAGVLPAVLLSIGSARGLDDAALVRGLATAGLVGAVIAARASLSGAEGGCQAETGAAAAMAAAAGVEMLQGTPAQASHALALALQGTLGLVCDPIGGLVEIPCVFRNATGSAIALAAIEMALAGIEFPVPADEVIDAMGEIGHNMSTRYRETAGGGLAATPTGRKLAEKWLVELRKK